MEKFKQLFQSLYGPEYYADHYHRLAAMVATLFGITINDASLGFAVHAICQFAGGKGPSCFYSTISGIMLTTNKVFLGIVILFANIVDYFDEKLENETHLAHLLATLIGLGAGSLLPKVFGRRRQ